MESAIWLDSTFGIYPRSTAITTDSVVAAIFLNALVNVEHATEEKDEGWFLASVKKIKDFTGMNFYDQARAISRLKHLEFIKVKYKRTAPNTSLVRLFKITHPGHLVCFESSEETPSDTDETGVEA